MTMKKTKLQRPQHPRSNRYIPVNTYHKKPKCRKHDFISKNKSDSINQKGIELEKSTMFQKNVLYGIGIFTSLILALFDIKDEGMLFEGLGFKFSGTSVAALFFIICLVGICKNKPKVILE